MVVEVDERTVKSTVHLGPLNHHPMAVGYAGDTNTLDANRAALSVFKRVLDFAEEIDDS